MNRISELDALRGLAAFAVVLFHYTTRFGQLYGHPEPPPFTVGYGAHGVDVFFMISGFVIFMTLKRVRTAADFVVSRFSRLFPAYWCAVLVTFSVVAWFGLPGRQVGVGDMLANLTMVHELFHVPDVDGVYWTLQIELMFYLAMLALYLSRLLPRIVPVLAVWLLLSLSVFALDRSGLRVPGSGLLSTLAILPHIPLFGLGILFFRVHAKEGRLALNLAAMAACLAAIAVEGGLEGLLAALVGCALFGALVRGRLGLLRLKAPVFLGTISYSLYLLHQHIGYIVLRGLYREGFSPVAAIPLAIAVAICAAAMLTFLVEKPAMRAIRRRYNEHRASAEVASVR
jgi:peptidoglycan/LPS O-acetylase OafA/YrhL